MALYTMSTTLFALFLAALSFMFLLRHTMREGVASELRNMASRLAQGSVAALQFNDDITASELVDYKDLDDQVLGATLYDAGGSVFAHYGRDGAEPLSRLTQADGVVRFGTRKAQVVQSLKSGGETIGLLHISRDLSLLDERLFLVGWIVCGILLGVLLLTLLTSTWLNRLVRQPMRELVMAASKVGHGDDDYSVRAQKLGEDEMGQLTDVFNAMLDRIQHHERDLRQSQVRLRQVIDLVPHMIFAKNRDGRLLLVNKTMADTLGTTVENLLDTPMSQWLPRQFLEATKPSDEEVFGTARPYFLEETLIDRDGGILHLQTTKIPFTESGSSVDALLGISIDMSRQKEAEQILLQSRDALDRRVQEQDSELAHTRVKMDRQEKLALVGRISGNVAHELRNPLSAVLQSAYLVETLLDQLDLDPSATDMVQKHLGIIKSEVEASNEVIVNLLGSVRVEKGSKKEKVDLAEVLSLSIERVWVEEWGRLVTNFQDTAMWVWGDFLQLRQVLVNLLENAKAAILGEQDPCVWVDVWAQDNIISVRITDNGAGMSEETLSRLFEPLYTTKAQGSGLGLSICREIVDDRHGGSIDFESSEGAGTQVVVTLPMYDPTVSEVGAQSIETAVSKV